jgi:hypothetical protein
MVCIFGSCRVLYGPRNYGPHRPFSFTHSSKVVLQLLKWKDKTIEELKNIYCNELYLLSDDVKSFQDFIDKINNIKNYVNKSNLIIIEICSLKEVLYNDIYLLWHRCNNKVLNNEYYPLFQEDEHKKIFNKLQHITSNKNEIINDLNEIKNILNDKKILFIPHFTAKINKEGEYIQERIFLKEILFEFCKNNQNCYLFDHLNFVDDNYETFYLNNNGYIDTCHMSQNCKKIIRRKLNIIVNKLK